MKTLKQLERLRKANILIQQENTGTPKELAVKLHVSERQIYSILEQLKDLDAPLLFNRKANTYYYNHNFDLMITISVQVLVKEELKTIYAGQTLLTNNYLTARLVQ